MPKLLIVDDEIDVREFAKNFFSRRNINVFTADNGMQALKLIDQEKPDLVMLDVRMGEMTGVDVLKELRKRRNDVKVIMVTGVNDVEIINETNQLGVKAYVHKPLILDELETIVLGELQ